MLTCPATQVAVSALRRQDCDLRNRPNRILFVITFNKNVGSRRHGEHHTLVQADRDAVTRSLVSRRRCVGRTAHTLLTQYHADIVGYVADDVV
jgi:hypothetical protein